MPNKKAKQPNKKPAIKKTVKLIKSAGKKPAPKKSANKKKQIKLLKIVIENLINKQSVEIIDLLAGKKHVNEFIIAKNLGLTINQTRNILYKLSDFGLVSFIRKKDKRKGWYIYFWTLNTYEALSLLSNNLKKKLEVLRSQLKLRKESSHYVCNTCSIEVNEETALLNNFTCPECYEVYELSDNSELIGDIDKKISKLKKELAAVSIEKAKEGEKLAKEKAKKIKLAEAEKKAKRIANRKKTAMEKAKLEKAEGKKTVSKKVKKKTQKKTKKSTSKKKSKSKKQTKKSTKKKIKKKK